MLILHEAAEEFLKVVSAGLSESEAEHSIILGLAEAVAGGIPLDRPPVLATLVEQGGLRGFSLRMPPHPCFLAAIDADATAEMAKPLYSRDPSCPGVVGSKPYSRRFAEAWSSVSGRPHALMMEQILYEVTEVPPPEQRPPGRMRPAVPADEHLVANWLHAFTAEAIPHERGTWEAARAKAERRIRAGEIHLWDAGDSTVAMAGFARETRTSISLNAVYTPPDLRGRGYGSALVAEMSGLALRRGKVRCVLYADAHNPVANKLYQRLGYRQVCEAQHWSFTEAG